MASPEGLVRQLELSRKFLKTTLGSFDEADSGFAPRPGLFTVAGHVAHVAGTVDWFVEGAFGGGWDMDFERHIDEAKAVTSLASAVEWVDRAYEAAMAAISSASDERLFTPIEDSAVMEGAPRASVVDGIAEHTAHHRGALAVYARLLGREPLIPYA